MQLIRSRIWLFMQIGVGVAIVVGLIAARGSRSASEPAADAGSRAVSLKREHLEAVHRVEALYAGISQHGEILGNQGAPVTLTFFGDPECPEARQFVLGALPLIVSRWVRSGKLRILYRSYPEETIWHGIFVRQAAAVLAAGVQDRLWQYLDLFYHHQRREYSLYATTGFLEARVREVRGLDLGRWQSERRSARVGRELLADKEARWEHGLRPGKTGHWLTSRETPAFFIGPTGGQAKPLLHFSLTESGAFDEAVKGVLGGHA